jgi:hypothetical protein
MWQRQAREGFGGAELDAPPPPLVHKGQPSSREHPRPARIKTIVDVAVVRSCHGKHLTDASALDAAAVGCAIQRVRALPPSSPLWPEPHAQPSHCCYWGQAIVSHEEGEMVEFAFGCAARGRRSKERRPKG